MNTPRNNSVLYLCKQRLDTPGARLFMGVLLALGLTMILTWTLTEARLPTAQAAPTGSVLYVDRDATGAGTGLSWTDAYMRLQDALDAAGPGDEIWVAEGVYTPTNVADRSATFQLKDGVALYGGFAATETVRTQRNWEIHVTVLSGDLDGNDVTDAHGVVTATANITGTNAYHVVTSGGVTGTAVLDGFSVTAGDTKDLFGYCQDGGGMVNDDGSPTLANLTFSGNFAGDGGGMYNNGGSPALTNVVFSANSADWGGGMYNSVSSPTLTSVAFSGNSANWGGGMHNYESSPALTDVVFSANSADDGGGMANFRANPTLMNITFSGNTASNSGGGMHNHESNLALTRVTFSGNIAGFGGGMLNSIGTLTLTNVTFSDNMASDSGGGMANCSGILTLTNVTFSDNTAGEDGGGMVNYDGNLTSMNVTFSGNSANYGGGIVNYSDNLIVRNTLFVKGAVGANCAGAAFATGSTHNLADDGSCGSSTTRSATINLGALGDYGGDTQTVPLLPGSAAIDAGAPAYCPATDQRGAGRVGTCDIGAFEAQGFTLAVLGGSGQSTPIIQMFPQPLQVSVTSDASPADPVDGGTVTFAAPASGASTYPVVYTATIEGGAAIMTATANCVAGGPYPVTASTAGAAAGVDFALTNTPDSMSTMTTLDSAPNPALFGQGVVFTATVTSICGALTGDVAFYDDGVLLGTGTLDGSGVATCTTSVLAAGTHPITAAYGGDANFDPSTSEVLSQVVRPPVYLPLVLRGAN